jgi:hypothetical protein
MDEMEMTTHESRRREPTGAYKGRKQKGKELDMKRCCWLTNLTSRVTVTEGAKADAALGERADGLEHGGPCARTGSW